MELGTLLGYVVWAVDPILVKLGPLEVRWYGLLFASGFFFGYYIVAYIFKKENKPETELDRLLILMVLSIVIGARLGHCLFYQPDYYLSNPIEILKIWEGGLASHGAAFAVIGSLMYYAHKTTGITFLWIADRILLTVALGGCFIRAGNLFNSEIYGLHTNGSYGFVYAKSAVGILEDFNVNYVESATVSGTGHDTIVDGKTYTQVVFTIDYGPLVKVQEADSIGALMLSEVIRQYSEPRLNFYPFPYKPKTLKVTQEQGVLRAEVAAWGVPRHPTQIYESASSLVLFLIVALLWYRYRENLPNGLNFGIFLIWIFGLRIVWESFKLNQVEFEDEMNLNMGQLLSFPLVAFGLGVLIYALYTQGHLLKQPKNRE